MLLAIVGGCATVVTGRLTRDVMRPASGDDLGRTAYRRELVARAHALHLSARREWLRLGHWQRGLTGFLESEADGENFFLSPNGKESPGAELDATLNGFFATLDAGVPVGTELQHPICQFPARYRWLDEQLGFDASRIAIPACPRFEEFRGLVDAQAVSFVFSSYYLNNPASVFGHTFVRIEKRGAASHERKELLDRAIEFSASVDTDNALLYGFKGLVGQFPGTFRNVPFYFKVRQYNDYESRDLYEYRLALTTREIEMFVAHLWELGSTYFDYFYVSENCSYHLLGALEVVRPSLDLLGHMHWPVIPADTIKALYANNLVEGVRTRPSLRRVFGARIATMSAADQQAVVDLAAVPSTVLPAGVTELRAIAILDAAQDLVDIEHAKDLTHSVDTPAARIKQTLLERRAEILVPSAELVVEAPAQSMPQLAHHSRRLGVGFAMDTAGHAAISVEARLALHDLVDSVPGYPELSQLEFLATRLHVRVDEAGSGRRVQLDSLSLVRIMSLTPRDTFNRKRSWRVDLGVRRFDDEGCAGYCYLARAAVGTGLAYASTGERLTVFAMVDAQVLSGPALDGIRGIPLRAGLGPIGGLRLRLTPRIVSLTTGEWIWLPAQEPLAMWEARSVLRLGVNRALAFDLEALLDARAATARLAALLYF